MSMTPADVSGKRLNRAKGAVTPSEAAQLQAQTAPPQKRHVPVELDPGNFAPKVGTDENDATDDVLRKAQGAFSEMANSLSDLHKRERAIYADTTQTPSAKNLKMRTLAHKVSDKTSERINSAYQSLQAEIGRIDREIERTFNGRQPEAKAQEIRTYMRGLKDSERRKLLSEGEPDVLSAVLSAKPFLSGCTPADAMKAKRDATEQLFPEEIKRRSKLERAADLISERSQIWLRETHGLYDHDDAEQAARIADRARQALEFGE